MADIKSAREIAMEKVAKLGDATEEERLQWRYVPEGEKLAAKYLKSQSNILPEINKYEGKAKTFVIEGIRDVLVKNIDLPRNETAKRSTKNAMDGLRLILQDKVAVENAFSKIRRVMDHYQGQGGQQKQQAYQELKQEFSLRVQQALKQQYGTASNMKIDVERQPQFQEEWVKLQAHLDSQYLKLLNEYKQELRKLS
ncbi:MAG: hypothetical protein ABID87_02220 [Chloroflexota bacterium]